MSTTYHYTLAELGELGVTDISLTYRSLAEDTLELRLGCPVATALPVPWAAEDRIIVSDEREEGTPRLFNGLVRSMRVSLRGGAYALDVEAANAVDVLARTIYAAGSGSLYYGQSFYEERALNDSGNGERLTYTRTVCERCFNYAYASWMDCSCVAQVSSWSMGVAGSGSQSCWALIQAAMRWVPDAATVMRYSSAGDVFWFMTARDMDAVTLDVSAGTMTRADGTPLGTFEGMTTCTLRPRHDLVPPVVALTGRCRSRLPEGESIRRPGAFLYHVREAGGGSTRSQVKEQARSVISKMLPVQKVEGLKANFLPLNAMGSGVNMRERDGNAPALTLKWWQAAGGWPLLNELGAGAVMFGEPMFEAVSAEAAFGSEGDGAEVPANYATPLAWGHVYLHQSGRFPASADSRLNLSGLKWCRGRLTQYIWATAKPAGISQEQFCEFFDGASRFYDSAGNNKMCRYTKLTVEGVWLNRASFSFREGSNEEVEEGSSSSGETSGSSGSTAVPGPDYEKVLRSYYKATRKLYYDGSIELTGVRGNPGALLATGINVAGLLPEWEAMETPCNEVIYDPIGRVATLTVGSRERLSFNELLERQNIGAHAATARSAGAVYNPEDSTPDVPESSTSDSGEDENVTYIAPNIVASHSASKGGTELDAWQIYADGTKWMLNGGVTPEGIEVEPIDITSVYAAGRKFYVRANAQGTGVIVRYRD